MAKLTKIKNVGSVKLNIDPMEKMRLALATKFVSQVGVLGSKAQGRKSYGKGSTPTNAEIGLVHEKGSMSRNIPRRSFLLFPLQHKAEGLIAIRHMLWKKFLGGDQSIGSLKMAYTHLGILATRIIHSAFDTGGFGKWQPLSARTIARKKSSAILIDTRQLERSIDSRVVAK
jgi:hypothetical protein